MPLGIFENYEITGNSAVSISDGASWTQTRYSCVLCLIPEDDGTWSALVLNLPGAGSCGPTKEDAIERAREAIAGLIESYTEDGEIIPWCSPTSENIPTNAELARIVVNA